MPLEIKLEEIGPDIESADIGEVLVSEGDMLEEGQDMLEIATDKSTTFVPSPYAGKVLKVHVTEGDTVPVGAVMITVEGVEKTSDSGNNQPAAEKQQPEKTEPPQAAPQQTQPEEAAAEPESAPVRNQPQQPAPAEPAGTPDAAPATAAPTESQGGSVDVAAGPAIRRFAREVGVDLKTVSGSGPGGRILRDDVLQVVRAGTKAGRPAAASGSTDTDGFGPVRIERMPKIRKTIAKKMHESWTTAPRVTNFDDADVTELEKFRQSSKADYAAKGVKLTSMPFVIKAVAMSLKLHPSINASVDMDEGTITYKEYVNIGIAVDTPRGLVVPVLKGAENLSIPETAADLGKMADKVRDGKFEVSDLRGGTFTISNLGAIGGVYSTPIINVPEVAILLVGRARKMPVVVDDEIAIRLMMPLSLSYDHRLVDGGAAARFLNEIIGFLKAPSRLLLAP